MTKLDWRKAKGNRKPSKKVHDYLDWNDPEVRKKYCKDKEVKWQT